MKKRIYLTIDDAPTKDFRDKLQYLFERHIPAILFCNGKPMQTYKEEMILALKRGYLIGSHGYEHTYFSDLSIEEAKESILKNDQIINGLYKEAGIERPVKVFRFPYFDQGGCHNSKDYEQRWSLSIEERKQYPNMGKMQAIQQYLAELGYIQPSFEGIELKYFEDKQLLEYIDVRDTFDHMEYYFGSEDAPYGLHEAGAILHRFDEDFPYEGRTLNTLDTTDIVLIHDHEHTTDLFYKIIDVYIQRGFEFQKCW